ncbi:hypothetical protein NQ318_003353 [Aromia moschata]|uniref:Protein singed wings 2 n=1 Tax=Aromia moschata TaxID=1265417 RepID=A0AAV8YB17_9CUCU|nr:hypothetical protein NQ318_003353 [Aromia moschata]
MITARPSKEHCVFEEDKLKCDEHLPDISYPSTIANLELTNLNWEILDLNTLLQKFPKLQRLTVLGKNIIGVVPPEEKTHIKTFLRNFPEIEVLNLDGNQLEALDKHFYLGNLKELYLQNNKWRCTDDLEWVLNLQNKTVIKNWGELICHGMPYSGKPLIAITHYLKDIKDQCTEKCECDLPNVVRDPKTDLLEPIISVNCSYKGFTELPEKLPKRTKILYLEGNSIEDLKPLRTNHMYRSLMDLYLDNNLVSSIGVLEGSYWLTHFRAFSLRGNKLTKELLQKYAPQVKDIHDIKCSYVEGDQNSLLPIAELSRSSVCRFPTEYSVQEALDLLNAVLVFLIVFILGKLAYDYYHFKKTGKLPWIVTKMP